MNAVRSRHGNQCDFADLGVTRRRKCWNGRSTRFFLVARTGFSYTDTISLTMLPCKQGGRVLADDNVGHEALCGIVHNTCGSEHWASAILSPRQHSILAIPWVLGRKGRASICRLYFQLAIEGELLKMFKGLRNSYLDQADMSCTSLRQRSELPKAASRWPWFLSADRC